MWNSVKRSAPRVGKIASLAVVVTMLAGFGSGERLFAPKAELWKRWSAHSKSASKTIDYSVWNKLLKKYVKPSSRGVNRFRYAAVGSADKKALKSFIGKMGKVKIRTYSRKAQLAYWINLYNAVTISVVLDHFPVKSIRDIDISPGLFADGPWGKKIVKVGGVALTLNDIEHRILRPIWRDSRIHYAVNCASIGCPDLQPKAYTATNVNGLLSVAARNFVNSERGVNIKGKKVVVSRIYDWFIQDFGGSEKRVLSHLLKYAKPGLKKKLKKIGDLHDTDYDWRLNGA